MIDFERDIRKDQNFSISTKDPGAAEELVEALDAQSWIEAKVNSLRLKYISPGTAPEYLYQDAFPSQVEKAYEEGCFVITADGRSYLLHETAGETFARKHLLSGERLSLLLKAGNYEGYADLINKSLELAEDKEKTYIGLRYGYAIALQGNYYQDISHRLIFEKAKEMLEKKFENYKVICVCFTPERSYVDYEVDAEKFQIKYSRILKECGYSEEDILSCLPFVRVSTSDTALEAISFTPYFLSTRDGIETKVLLGEPQKSKHTKKLDGSRLLAKAERCFALISSNMEKIQEMMNKPLQHPEAAFVNAVNAVPKVRDRCITAFRELYNEYLFDVLIQPEQTGYDVLLKLSDVVNTESFLHASRSTKLSLEEGLYQLLSLDWEKLDVENGDEIADESARKKKAAEKKTFSIKEVA